jgi:CheY-like chemotaxis protein
LHALPDGVGQIEFGLGARHFAEGGSASLRAGLAPGDYVHLFVSDTGCGMDQQMRDHIFEPFFTSKPVGEGTGLGLPVVHGLVKTLGGVIDVTSEVGRGSTFDVYLPLSDVRPQTVYGDLLAEPPRGSGEHIFYVDDDEVMALMVQGLLQRLGYRTTCFLEAQNALDAIRAGADVDLVVTDFNMPQVSGLDVARELRRSRPTLPVVISSGYVSDELRASAAEIGVHSIMHKERSLEELGNLVGAALHRKRFSRPG